MIAGKISYFVLMGDSLTFRGFTDEKVFGFIPLKWLVGLDAISPKGRFTNGYVWSDYFSAEIAERFIIKEVAKEKKMDATDIADALIAGDRCVKNRVENFSLDNGLYVRYKNIDIVRAYSQGGLTAANYRWQLSWSPARFLKRMILTNLGLMREKLLRYDNTHEISELQKAQTLVIEWSGANDLITVNAHPSIPEVDRAIEARIENIKELIKNGYRHFFLFNIPDLSLTPRFQALDSFEQQRAKNCSLYFNEKLRKSCNELKIFYPHCSVEYFDVNGLFTEIISEPEKYGFSKDKLFVPYVESPDFKLNPQGTSPATGYPFFDLHPSADMHALLAQAFFKKLFSYNIEAPEVLGQTENKTPNLSMVLRNAFVQEYTAKLAKDKSGLLGRWRYSNIDYRNESLHGIFFHALHENGFRTRETLRKLKWLDENNKIKLNVAALEPDLIALQQDKSAQMGMGR